MASVLQRILKLISDAILKARSPADIRRLLKWAIAFVAFVFWYRKLRCRRHDNIVMVPDWSPITGHLWLPYQHWDEAIPRLYELLKRGGFPKVAAVSANFPFYIIMILDPEVARVVFESQFDSFKKGQRIQDETEELLGDGIFASDPPQWKFHRKVASRMFSMRNLRNYMFECAVVHTKKVIDKIDSDEAIQSDVDIYNILSRFTLDSFTAIAFGKSCESTAFYPRKHPFAEAFDDMVESVAKRHLTIPPNFWKLMRWLPFEVGNEGEIKRNMRVINDFADSVLDSRQTDISGISDEAGDKHNDLISLFSKHDASLTRAQLKCIAMNMIIAGRDTTRLLLSWFLYDLCHEAEVRRKVYAEMDALSADDVDYATVSASMRYTECALLESLRLHPAVPFLARTCLRDVKLPNGNIIREGDDVMIPTYAFARNPKIYADPLKFDPTRFEDEKKDPVHVFSVYEYPFFNINPRLCLGRHLALMEAKVFLFYFLRQYEFEMVDPKQEIKIRTGIVLNMAEGLRLKLSKRKYSRTQPI